jgi:hypothetical protein
MIIGTILREKSRGDRRDRSCRMRRSGRLRVEGSSGAPRGSGRRYPESRCNRIRPVGAGRWTAPEVRLPAVRRIRLVWSCRARAANCLCHPRGRKVGGHCHLPLARSRNLIQVRSSSPGCRLLCVGHARRADSPCQAQQAHAVHRLRNLFVATVSSKPRSVRSAPGTAGDAAACRLSLARPHVSAALLAVLFICGTGSVHPPRRC